MAIWLYQLVKRFDPHLLIQGLVYDFAPDGIQLPRNQDVIKAIGVWNGQGCLVVNMAPQPLGRVFNASANRIHRIRVEMKTAE